MTSLLPALTIAALFILGRSPHIAMPHSRPPNIPGFRPLTQKPATRFPAGACDCHAHVFGPQSRFPYAQHAAYIAPDAVTADYVRMLRNNGCDRGVLVQPSVYGTDNACMLDALRSGSYPLRGIAVVAADVTDRELQGMHDAGVRGIRINLASETEGLTLADGERLAPRLKEMGWHLQFYLDLPKMPEAAERLAALPITAVIDHFARCQAKDGTASPAFRSLLALLQHEHIWAKAMGPYFLSRNAPRYADVTPLAQALVAAAPDRVVWGTDWPHPGARDLMPEDHVLADLLAEWIPEDTLRRQILVDNPARLYGF